VTEEQLNSAVGKAGKKAWPGVGQWLARRGQAGPG